MGRNGFACVPVGSVQEYVKTAWTSYEPDGSVKHYHVQISRPPKSELFSGADAPRLSVEKYTQPLE